MLVLAGIGVVVVGFALRLNPLLVVVTAALVTGLAAGLDVLAVTAAFGKAFKTNRYVSVVYLVLPVVGLLERGGLQERARALILKVKAAAAGRLLVVYLVIRQLTAALGLTSVFGHPQTVRPLIAPMAEAAEEVRSGAAPSEDARQIIRAYAAATDNIGLFFGEDIFIAIASILLIKGFLEQSGIFVEPLQLSVWAIPTAVCAFAIHGFRLLMLDRRLARMAALAKAGAV